MAFRYVPQRPTMTGQNQFPEPPTVGGPVLADFQSENGPNDRWTVERAIFVGASSAKSIGRDRAVVVSSAPETKKWRVRGNAGAPDFLVVQCQVVLGDALVRRHRAGPVDNPVPPSKNDPTASACQHPPIRTTPRSRRCRRCRCVRPPVQSKDRAWCACRHRWDR